MKLLTAILLAGIFNCAWNDTHANNVQIANLVLTGQDTVNNTYQIQFDLTWENSWRTSTFESNWDAVWVFAKYRLAPAGDWHHCMLDTSGTVAASGSTVSLPEDMDVVTSLPIWLGAFVYRESDGIGDVSYTGLELRWNYGANGIDDFDVVDISMFAIEMVYIPEGPFYLGDGSVSNIEGQFDHEFSGNPYFVASEAAFDVGGNAPANQLTTNNGTGMSIPDDFAVDLMTYVVPAEYPKGYAAFYIMKYEMSQGQYTDFLNHLTQQQASNRYADEYGNARYTIDSISTLQENTYAVTAPDWPCGWLNWDDASAYADWAALRPLTELEYEKAARGPLSPATHEFAWGTPFIHTSGYATINDSSATEVITNPGSGTGNANFFPTGGGVLYRCGIFAASALSPVRDETGSSYYGVMEMSGNLMEIYVTIGSAAGRQFVGVSGDGELDMAGDDDAGWPGEDGTGATPVAWRGGSYNDNIPRRLETSNRLNGAAGNAGVLARGANVSVRLGRASQ
ncbi:MAG: SUMF1/EgtB/PvdO family nonheme iron enzyme [Saprospiraceae bacterium]|nr:SUMF1/EgtB/PvdO family nonheme iron enzyme [Saprospiraceae bacterium]